MRTTSSIEAFNSVLNRSIAKRPNFFKLVERLKFHESRKADNFFNLAHDDVPMSQYQPRHMKDRVRNQKINELTEMLTKNRIDVERFLELMADEENCMYFNRWRNHLNVILGGRVALIFFNSRDIIALKKFLLIKYVVIFYCILCRRNLRLLWFVLWLNW